MSPRQSPTYLSIQQVAELYGLNPKTVRRRIADGSLTAHRLGPRLIRLDVDEVKSLLNPIPTAGSAA